MSLESWTKHIDAIVGTLASESTLGIGGPANDVLYRRLGLAGFSGVMPLWSGRRHVVGLLVDPTVDHEAWAAVILDDGDALTLATDSRTLLPQLIVKRVLSKFPEAGKRLADGWGRVGTAAKALHLCLGGTHETLDEVVEVTSSPVARESFRYVSGNEARFEHAHSDLLRRIDGSDSFVRFAAWMDEAVAGRRPELAPFDAYGAWGRRVTMSAQRMAVSNPKLPRPPADSLHRLVQEFAGVDSAIAAKPSWAAQAGAASGEAALVEAATAIEREALSSEDPVAKGIVIAMLAEGSSYSGLAHAEATVVLDEQGDVSRAWAVLQSASWWSARTLGEAPEAMLEAARSMATRHRWDETLWVLDRNAASL
jgi:hypothetical protein